MERSVRTLRHDYLYWCAVVNNPITRNSINLIIFWVCTVRVPGPGSEVRTPVHMFADNLETLSADGENMKGIKG